MDPTPLDGETRAPIVAGNLRVDAATAEVFRAFAASRVAAVLLKGPSLGRWLYEADDPRPYLDCDVLVGPHDVAGAEKALSRLGFVKQLDEQRMPEWWREHASDWWRNEDAVRVDLHRSLPGIGVDPGKVWRTLSAGTETIVVAGYRVRTLALPGRALHVALHAAHHGSAWGKPIDDVARAVARAERTVWRDAKRIAERLEATEAFAVGLRMTPAGEALAAELQLPVGRSVEAALRASSPPPVALGFEQLARASTARARVRIVWSKLVPPPEFIRHWSPTAVESRRDLLRAYVRRPIWLVRRAPEGWRAWRRARQQVRSSRK